MRNRKKRETDISTYTDKLPDLGLNTSKSESTAKRVLKGIAKALLTVMAVLIVGRACRSASISSPSPRSLRAST